MTTRFVGIKELRQHMAKISSRAHKKKERIVVLRKNKPVFELRPLTDEAGLLESLIRDIEEARADVKSRRLHSQAGIEKMLGL